MGMPGRVLRPVNTGREPSDPGLCPPALVAPSQGECLGGGWPGLSWEAGQKTGRGKAVGALLAPRWRGCVSGEVGGS